MDIILLRNKLFLLAPAGILIMWKLYGGHLPNGFHLPYLTCILVLYVDRPWCTKTRYIPGFNLFSNSI